MKSRNKGIVLAYAGNITNMVAGLFLSSFLLRMLGDTEYGVYQTIASFANYLVLLEFGTGTVMTRNISMCRGKQASAQELQANISTIWTITNVLAVLIAIVSVVFYRSIGMIYASSLTAGQIQEAGDIFIFVTIHLILSFYIQTFSGIALGHEHYTYSSALNLIRTGTRTVMLIVLIFIWREGVVIAATDAFLSGVILVFSLIYCRKKFQLSLRFRDFRFSIFRSSFPMCFAIFLQSIVNQANNNVDKFIIGIKLSPEMVSLYSVALFVFSVFSSLTTVPISLYAPQVAKEISAGAAAKDLAEKLVPAVRLTAIVGGAVLFGFIGIGQQFITLLYGRQYLQAWIIAIILMAPMYLNMVVGVLVNVLDALNKRMVRSAVLMGTTMCNILLTIFWLDRWGVVGAALATCVTTFAGQVFLMGAYYSKVLKLPIFYLYRRAFSGILPSLVLGCAAGFTVGFLVENEWLSFLAGGVVFVAVTLGIYILFGATAGERTVIRRFLRRGKKHD